MKNTIATITSSRSLTLAIAALISAVAGGPAQAATIDWNPPTVGGGGSVTWATGANWGGVAPVNDLTTDIARFDKTTYNFQPDAGTTSITGIQVGDGTTATANLTLSGTNLSIGAGGITKFLNSGNATISSGVILAGSTGQTWTNNSATGLTVTGLISGSDALIISGTGTTTIQGIAAANTYSGGTTIKSGTLKMGTSTSNTWELATFGTGAITIGDTSGANSATLMVGGSHNMAGPGMTNALVIASGSSGNLTIIHTGSQDFFSGNITLNHDLILANTSASATYSGTITGTKNLIINDTSSVSSNNFVGLQGNNTSTWTGNVYVQAGVFQVAQQTSTTKAVSVSNTLYIASGGTFDDKNSILTVAGINDWNGGGGVIDNTAPNARGLILGGSGNYSFSGTIKNTGAAASLGLTVALTGSGSQTLSGNNTYGGGTLINTGTLTLSGGGSLGATAVTVGAAASTGLNIGGNYTIGTATGGTLTVNGGATGSQGTLSLVDGTANTLTLANNSAADVFTIGSTTASQNSILNMEVGATSDKIVVGTGTSLVNLKIQNGAQTKIAVNITGLGGLTGSNQTLISAPGGVGTTSTTRGTFANAFTLGTTSGNFGGYTVALGNSTTSLYLTETANTNAGGSVYWKGTNDGVWNSFTGGNTNTSNFATAVGGTNANFKIGSTNDVIFNATSSANTTTTLGEDFTIKSLAFNSNATGAVTIGGSNTLTITPSSSANGVNVAAGSGNHTLSTKVALGADQTWTVTDAAQTLAASNQISGGFALTKAGAGTLNLSGNNTYTGTTTVSTGTLLITGSTSSSSAVAVQAGATLGGSGTVGGATSLAGSTIGSAGNTLTLSNTLASTGSSNVASGSTVNVAGGTTITSGTLIVSGTLGGGTVTVSNTATLGGTGTITAATNVQSGGTLSPGNSPGNQIFSGGLTLAGSYKWELGALSTLNPGTDFDTITVTAGNVNLTGASINLTLGIFAPTNVAFWQSDKTWSNILNNTGAGTLTGSFAPIDNSSWSTLGSFTTTYTANDVNLVWTAVPEPATWGLLAFSLTTVMILRRRRNS